MDRDIETHKPEAYTAVHVSDVKPLSGGQAETPEYHRDTLPGWGKSLSPLSIANSSFWKSNIFHATNENIVTGCTAVTVMCFTLQGRPTLEECMLDVTGEMAKQ